MRAHLAFGILMACISSAAVAQAGTKQNIERGYHLGNDGCPHRDPVAVLQGKPHIECEAKQMEEAKAGPPPNYTTATPAQVIAALECDIADAFAATKGKPADLSQALITGVVKFA